MRVISQDGAIDVPYDLAVLDTNDNGVVHAVLPGDKLAGTMAKYSSKEKALKALEKLKTTYSRISFLKTTYTPGTLTALAKEYGDEETIKLIAPVFQFPQDEEIC